MLANRRATRTNGVDAERRPVGIDLENLGEGYFVVMAQRMPQVRRRTRRLDLREGLGEALSKGLAAALIKALAEGFGLRRRSATR